MSGVPDISVVMSVYNNEDTLSTALESILSQQGVELEFIVIDDGSTDGSGKILDEAAARDPRLKVIHKKNEGLTRALIEGCAMASAPWIARQDADDRSRSGRLRAQLERARQDDHPVLVGCAVQVTVPEGVVMEEIHPPTSFAAARRQLLEEGRAISPHGSIVFSREAYRQVGGYRAVFYYAQDIDLTTRLAEVGSVSAVDECFYEYVFSPSALSGCFGSYQRRFYHLIREGHARRELGESEESLLMDAEVLRQECLRAREQEANPYHGNYYVGSCLLPSNPEIALGYLKKAVFCRPWSGKTWVRLTQAWWLSERREHETSGV